MLKSNDHTCYLEVKCCTLVENRIALFPDAPTLRGQKHLRELVRAQTEGYKAAVIFLVQRNDAEYFSPNDATDSHFAKEFWNAKKAGVEIHVFSSKLIGFSMYLQNELPVIRRKMIM